MSCPPVLELTVEEFEALTSAQLYKLGKDKLIVVRRSEVENIWQRSEAEERFVNDKFA